MKSRLGAAKTRLSRRDFLRMTSVSLLAGLGACNPLRLTAEAPTAAGIPVPSVPPTATPTPLAFSPNEEFYNRPLSLAGERYAAQVPDTLDFQRHAELSLNALTRCTDPDTNYSVYFYGRADRNPPILTNAEFNGKFPEATLMMRQVSGSRVNQHVDQVWRAKFLRWLVDENLVLAGCDLGRMFAWMALMYSIEGDERYRQLGEKAIEQMLLQSRSRDNYRYFPGENGAEPKDFEIVSHGWTLQGIARFYEATGFAPAESLGKEIARYLKDHSGMFDSSGRFLYRHQREWGPVIHFHHNGNTLLSIAELAAITGDGELASFAKLGYEFARGTGSPLVGFFPEYIPDTPGQFPLDCETCDVADMVLLALHLSKAGQADYWDDVDRYVRNQLVENHMKQGAWIDEYSAALPASPVPDGATGDRVSERAVGSFSGWVSANEYLIAMSQPLVSACCTGNGSRALYYVWRDMLDFVDGRLKLHLLFNRASRWADVNSFIPYGGTVDVSAKTNCDLEIRLPEWVSPEEARGAINGAPIDLTYSGRYARFGRVQRGDTATLTFPISERTVQAQIGDGSYDLTIKGNEVVEIHPPGLLYPSYERARYRHSSAPLIQLQRYVG